MNLERLLDVLSDNEREREKLSELLAWVSEEKASEVLARAHKSVSHGMALKHEVQYELMLLSLRHSDEFGYV